MRQKPKPRSRPIQHDQALVLTQWPRRRRVRKDDDNATYPGTLDDPHVGAALAANCHSLASMFAAKAAPTKNSVPFASPRPLRKDQYAQSFL